MSILLSDSKLRERRGSKPRCHLLTHGSADVVAARLTAAGGAVRYRNADDRWMPQGFEDTEEATLPEAVRFLTEDVRLELRRWWLVVASMTRGRQTGILLAPARIEGKARVLLIEAKAHDQELVNEETGGRTSKLLCPGTHAVISYASTGRFETPVPHWHRKLD